MASLVARATLQRLGDAAGNRNEGGTTTRGIKTLTIGGSLLINFVAILWTAAMFLNGKTLGGAAAVSLDDSYVAIGLLARTRSTRP